MAAATLDKDTWPSKWLNAVAIPAAIVLTVYEAFWSGFVLVAGIGD